MAIVFQIVLGLSLLGSFIACYFCSKYWHWAHVLLTETVFLLSLAFLILAGEVFRIQNVYGKQNQQTLAQIERLEPQVEALSFGTDNSRVINELEGADVPIRMQPTDNQEESGRMQSVRDLNHKLGLVTRTRGRVWRDAEILNRDGETLTITLGIPAPNPHGIAKDAILYVFEQGEAAPYGTDGPQYIGEFRVVSAADQQVQLQPASQFDDQAIARLGNSRSPWILYENMPVDQHPEGEMEILADATEDDLKRLLPGESLEEYVRHGKDIRSDDDDWHKTGYNADGELVKPDDWDASTQFKYRRTLRDYNLYFQELSKRYTQMEADYNALSEDNKQLEKALASAKQVQAFREQEQSKLRNDLTGVSRDRQAIEAHQSQVDTQLSNAKALLDDLQTDNSRLAEELVPQAE